MRTVSAIRNHRGKRFGRLTAVSYIPGDKRRPAQWRCVCDCGEEVVVRGYLLPKTESCGCAARWEELPPEVGPSEAQRELVRSALAFREKFGHYTWIRSHHPLRSAYEYAWREAGASSVEWGGDMLPCRFNGTHFGGLGPLGF